MVSMVTGLASLTSRTSMGVLVVGGVVRKLTHTHTLFLYLSQRLHHKPLVCDVSLLMVS